jgi:hypothetical protein
MDPMKKGFSFLCIVFILTLGSLVSCKNDPNDSVFKLTRVPETVKLGDSIELEAIYNPDLESLEIDKNDIIIRHTYLSFTSSIIDSLNIISIENSEHQRIVDTIGTGRFKFMTVFNNSGVNELNFGVEDYLIIKSRQEKNMADSETIIHSGTKDSIQIEKLKLEYFKNTKIMVQPKN